MRRRRYKRYNMNNSDRKRLYIIGGIVLAVLVIILVVVLTLGMDKDSSEKHDGDKDIKLGTNAVLQVNQLIERYYEAKKACDATALMSLIYPSMTIDESELRIEVELVEDYQDIVCYTLPGLTEDSYVVWVEFEYKFHGIDKAAPALNRLYAIKSTETEEYQIYVTPDDEMVAYMEKLSKREDVKALSEKIEGRLQKALAADESLMNFYSQLAGETAR